MAKLPLVSIIIINFKRVDDTIKAFDSIRLLSYPKTCIELIIIDNLPEKKSVRKLMKWSTLYSEEFFRVVYHQNNENIGLSLALNQALDILSQKSRYVWRFDNDAIAHPRALIELVKVIENDESIGFVGSAAYNYDKHEEFTDGAWKIHYWIGYASLLPNTIMPIVCDYVAGRSQLFSTNLARKIGYIADPCYFAYFEDVDFCVQIQKLKKKVVFVPSSIIYHRFDPNGESAPYKVFLMTRNRIYFMRKNASLLQKCTFLPLFTLFGIAAFLLYLLKRSRPIREWKQPVRSFYLGMVQGLTTTLR